MVKDLLLFFILWTVRKVVFTFFVFNVNSMFYFSNKGIIFYMQVGLDCLDWVCLGGFSVLFLLCVVLFCFAFIFFSPVLSCGKWRRGTRFSRFWPFFFFFFSALWFCYLYRASCCRVEYVTLIRFLFLNFHQLGSFLINKKKRVFTDYSNALFFFYHKFFHK